MGRAVAEHEALMADAGALGYLRKDGWVFLYRSHRSFHAAAQRLDLLRELGVRATVLDAAGALALEAHLSPVFERAVHWPDVATVSNPLAVTQAYVSRFQQLGGSLHRGDALSLSQAGRLWRVAVADGSLEAPDVVVALGPWTPELLKLLGLRLPFGVQRGYHRHYRARGNAGLSRPVVDIEYGYVLAPMEQGIRLTTGAEFALHGAPPTPVQFGRLLSEAHRLFPLGELVEATPWLGARPCLSDMRPVIGRAPRHRGIWLNFGHNHFGLTLGPVTGRLLAEMIDGTQPFCDAAPFAAERFLR